MVKIFIGINSLLDLKFCNIAIFYINGLYINIIKIKFGFFKVNFLPKYEVHRN